MRTSGLRAGQVPDRIDDSDEFAEFSRADHVSCNPYRVEGEGLSFPLEVPPRFGVVLTSSAVGRFEVPRSGRRAHTIRILVVSILVLVATVVMPSAFSQPSRSERTPSVRGHSSKVRIHRFASAPLAIASASTNQSSPERATARDPREADSVAATPAWSSFAGGSGLDKALDPMGATTQVTAQLARTASASMSPLVPRNPRSIGIPTATKIPVTSTIQAFGGHLILNGSFLTFTGVNAYEAATEWGENAGCGGQVTDAQLDQLFSSLPPNSLVRISAFQAAMATNVNTHQPDWAPLDRVFAAAAAYNQKLIVVVSGQGAGCDGAHWQDLSWYSGGFLNTFNTPQTTDGRGLTPLSYWTYLQDLVSRYRASTALGMWEPMGEAEASTCSPPYEPTNCSGHQTCPNEEAAASALRHFYDTVGGEIHSLDPNHLVESGTLGSEQCGTEGSDYRYVSASSGIDVLSYHDYYGASPPGSASWSAIDQQISVAVALDKPIIAGEVGMNAGLGPGCESLDQRNADIAAKQRALVSAGGSGSLVWDWTPDVESICGMDVGPSDPLMQPGGAVG